MTVILAVVMLWGLGLSLMIVLVNTALGANNRNEDFPYSFLENTVQKEHNELEGYLQVSMMNKQKISYTGLSESYKQHFDPEKTNLRFLATDSDGTLILSNIPEGKTEEKLVSSVTDLYLRIGREEYTVTQHYADPVNDFPEIVSSDHSGVLENTSDFQLWYFSDNLVDNAYHQGVEARLLKGAHSAVALFDSEQAAKDYDFTWAFGESCEHTLMQLNADGVRRLFAENDAELYDCTGGNALNKATEYRTNMTAAVSVQYYTEARNMQVSLNDYYKMKRNGEQIYALNSLLEQKLSAGLELTVSGVRQQDKRITLQYYLPASLPVTDDIRGNYLILSHIYSYSESALIAVFVFFLLTVAVCVPMCAAAGRRSDTGELHAGRLHRMTYEFFWLLPLLMLAAGGIWLGILFNVGSSYRVTAIFCVGIVLMIAASSILWLYTTAVRVKTNTFWQSFGLIRLFRQLLGLFRGNVLSSVLVTVYVVVLGILNAVVMRNYYHNLDYHDYIAEFAMLLLDLLTLLFLLYCIYAYFELHRHAGQIEKGDFTAVKHKIPLHGDFAAFDRSLSGITDSVAEIVDRQMRAEHLRTELITNVSHDLKTPLTSIVNYVDLLSREPMQTAAAEEYLEVLRRQAARLKKLTLDLVDASKASTGNLTVELVPTNVQVLIGQITAEYEEQLSQHGLTLMQNIPEEPLMIQADGRQIWRVFDNLLNNACKYALQGTRVYLDVCCENAQILVTLKNISATQLNVTAEELMERFVRGDASRHTEGSGLGLSIARDLTALQNGTLELQTDGDLFKALLRFPQYCPPEESQENENHEAEV